MRRESTPPAEDIRIVCPHLGHLVPFSYCRRENRGAPCCFAIECWYDHFLVEDYFHGIMNPEEWSEAFERAPEDRLRRIMEIIEETRKWT